MQKREVVKVALNHRRPPYVPWHFSFTSEAAEKLRCHYGVADLDAAVGNHLLFLGDLYGFFEDLGGECYRDYFGVVWDKSVEKDIGMIKGCVLPEPTLSGYEFPDPEGGVFFRNIERDIAARPDGFRVYALGFSLFERAWTLRGMENLMMDMVEEPEFVHALLGAIADWNIANMRQALKYDIDAIHFGDDWGQQHGLMMGPKFWREFIYPQLKRMYAVGREAGKFVSIHSCGDVDEVFGDLVGAGLNCFNPFQPEVMDIQALKREYAGRLAFFGGLSTQKTLPFGTAAEVRREAEELLALGAEGGYIFSPAHAVEGDVSLENMLAFIETAQAQPGFKK